MAPHVNYPVGFVDDIVGFANLLNNPARANNAPSVISEVYPGSPLPLGHIVNSRSA